MESQETTLKALQSSTKLGHTTPFSRKAYFKKPEEPMKVKDEKLLRFSLCRTQSERSIAKGDTKKQKSSESKLEPRQIKKPRKITCSASVTASPPQKEKILKPKSSSTSQTTPPVKSICMESFENAFRELEQKFKAYESGDFLNHSSTKLKYNDEDIKTCLNDYGQTIKLNTSIEKVTQPELSDSAEVIKDLSLSDESTKDMSHTKSVNVLFNEVKGDVKYLNSDFSEESILESGYKTGSNSSNIKRELEQSNSSEISKKLCQLINEIVASNNRNAEDKDALFIKEMAKTLENDLKIEKQLSELLLKDKSKQVPLEKDESLGIYNLRGLEESLAFVKENLTSIKYELNDFKENCWSKIDSKVDKIEFDEATAHLKSKLSQLERRIFNENKTMKQDLSTIAQKIKSRSEHALGIKNFPIWPFVAFLGAYSIMHYGSKPV